jgi:hypothetical protein
VKRHISVCATNLRFKTHYQMASLSPLLFLHREMWRNGRNKVLLFYTYFSVISNIKLDFASYVGLVCPSFLILYIIPIYFCKSRCMLSFQQVGLALSHCSSWSSGYQKPKTHVWSPHIVEYKCPEIGNFVFTATIPEQWSIKTIIIQIFM